MILEFEMYAPYRLPGASVRFVPFQAAIPPPHARLARVTFSNQLRRVQHIKPKNVTLADNYSRRPEAE